MEKCDDNRTGKEEEEIGGGGGLIRGRWVGRADGRHKTG